MAPKCADERCQSLQNSGLFSRYFTSPIRKPYLPPQPWHQVIGNICRQNMAALCRHIFIIGKATVQLSIAQHAIEPSIFKQRIQTVIFNRTISISQYSTFTKQVLNDYMPKAARDVLRPLSIRSRVYCCCGLLKISSTVPCSTMRPRRITITRLQISLITARSCEIKR